VPDKDGKLTEEDRSRALSWLAAKWSGPRRNCPICTAVQWAVGEHVVAPLLHSSEGTILGGPVAYPNVPIICASCGYTFLMNAVRMGIVPRGKADEQPK
jgi:hypothetical protein